MSIEYFIVLDRVLFHILQFLKIIGQCNGDEVIFEFIDDATNAYDYNQFSAVTLVEGQLNDLTSPGNLAHLTVLQDFVMKRNFSLIVLMDSNDPIRLQGPIKKIFGRKIDGDDLLFDDRGTFVQFNLFGPPYYTLETNLVNSHISNIGSPAVSTTNLLRVIPFNNLKPGLLSSFERMNDGGC